MRRKSKKPASVKPEEDLSALWPSPDIKASLPLLKALHILTRDGHLNADSRRKLKQVLHLVQLLRAPLSEILNEESEPILADLGAGKSYLGFILYDLIFRKAGKGRVIEIEERAELMQAAQALARQSDFTRMEFMTSSIQEAQLGEGHVDIVTALHACDTATDEAILFALRHEARLIALIPCCQAELARGLEGLKGPLEQLWRHPLQRREFASLSTNVLRGLYLEAHGYKVRVTEFTGLEHTMKNELILGIRHQRANPQARAEFEQLATQLGVKPALLSFTTSMF